MSGVLESKRTTLGEGDFKFYIIMLGEESLG